MWTWTGPFGFFDVVICSLEIQVKVMVWQDWVVVQFFLLSHLKLSKILIVVVVILLNAVMGPRELAVGCITCGGMAIPPPTHDRNNQLTKQQTACDSPTFPIRLRKTDCQVFIYKLTNFLKFSNVNAKFCICPCPFLLSKQTFVEIGFSVGHDMLQPAASSKLTRL